jgi:hypothetical protein
MLVGPAEAKQVSIVSTSSGSRTVKLGLSTAVLMDPVVFFKNRQRISRLNVNSVRVASSDVVPVNRHKELCSAKVVSVIVSDDSSSISVRDANCDWVGCQCIDLSSRCEGGDQRVVCANGPILK